MMKRIVLLMSCMFLSMQLIAEHSWAECKSCGRQYQQEEPSLKSSFDPEWNRWDKSCCCGMDDAYCADCQEDSSELVNAV